MTRWMTAGIAWNMQMIDNVLGWQQQVSQIDQFVTLKTSQYAFMQLGLFIDILPAKLSTISCPSAWSCRG